LALIGVALSAEAGVASAKEPRPIYPVIEERSVGAEMRIQVPPAKVSFEIDQARRKPPKRLSSESEVSDWIRRIASSTLLRKGIAVAEADADELLAAGFTELSDELLRPRPASKEALDLLRRLGDGDVAAAALVHHLKVEIGPEGRYDSFGGRIELELRSSTLRGALIRCSSGEVLWRGEMFIRSVPSVEDSNFESAITGLYDGLSLEGGPTNE
jgi:hypothetical protein